jgi:DNA mismatch repair protein MutS
MSARDTPVMRQHAEAKLAYPDALVFFRLGDFYELFGADAVVAAKQLELTLTSRNKGAADEIPMCGVPHHAAHVYIGRLLEAGHQVAICEQMADPAKCKGIVPRQVVRVLTPGLLTDQEQLDAGCNNWLVAFDLTPGETGLASLDISTGELSSVTLPDAALLLGELARLAPRECLFELGESDSLIQELSGTIRHYLPNTLLRTDPPIDEAETHSLLQTLICDTAPRGEPEKRAVARVLRFARQCTMGKDLPIRRLTRITASDQMIIDEVAQSHLELIYSLRGDKIGTLFSILDATHTPAGTRLLRRRLVAPLCNASRIRRRLDAVEAFVLNSGVRVVVRESLSDVGDLERLVTRVVIGEATPRDLASLRDGLAAAARVVSHVESVNDASFREALELSNVPQDTVAEVTELLSKALTPHPPALVKEGAIFQSDYDEQLSGFDLLRSTGAERITELEGRLRDSTGISTLKVRFTRVFGWYIEVSRAQASKAPTEWRRKQTIATGERFTVPELEDLADRISHAEEQYRERELELFRELLTVIARATSRIQDLSGCLSRWDIAAALAELAHRYDYCRPSVDDSLILEIEDGRHPVVERLAAAGRFVPNDCRLDIASECLWLITGPNMAGKSTFLRQVAIIVLLAQMGSYVPAKRARVGVVDRILSRVGASDNVARGESTFMIEMRETSRILRNATRRSLVILDEIGRGTSTYDGLAIAWAVTEYLDEVIGCRALFATHYHELTRLESSLRHAANFSVTAKEVGEDVVFLYQLVRGAASRSYGVAVAKLAELPEPVISRAKSVLAELEDQTSAIDHLCTGRIASEQSKQLDLFRNRDPMDRRVLDIAAELKTLTIDQLTPIEALSILDRWKKRLQTTD